MSRNVTVEGLMGPAHERTDKQYLLLIVGSIEAPSTPTISTFTPIILSYCLRAPLKSLNSHVVYHMPYMWYVKGYYYGARGHTLTLGKMKFNYLLLLVLLFIKLKDDYAGKLMKSSPLSLSILCVTHKKKIIIIKNGPSLTKAIVVLVT